MENFLKMVNVQSILFIYLLVGIFCRKTKLFDDHVRAKLTDFVIHITLPCMIFESFHMPFSTQTLQEGGSALLIASCMALLALLLGKLAYVKFPRGEKVIMQYGTLVTNSGFAGLPVISGMYGGEGLLLGSVFIIPTRILMWSAGLSLFTKGTGGTLKKVALHPTLIAVYLGLIRMVLQIPLPAFMDGAIDGLGDCTSPIAMALVGAILADSKLRTVFSWKAFYLVAVRQIVLPLLCLLGLRLLHVDALIMGVSVTLSAMPIGSTTAILAQKYGADASFASKCVFVSTLLSLVTVPLITLLL